MSTDAISPLRQSMIEDMAARKLGRHAQRSHIHSCRRFAAFLGRSPDTVTAEDEGLAGQGRDRGDPAGGLHARMRSVGSVGIAGAAPAGSTAGSKVTPPSAPSGSRAPAAGVAVQQPGATLNRPVPKGGDTFQALPPAAGKGVGKR